MTITQEFMKANRALDDYRRALDDISRGAGENRIAARAAAAAAEEVVAMSGLLWKLHSVLMDKANGVKALALPESRKAGHDDEY